MQDKIGKEHTGLSSLSTTRGVFPAGGEVTGLLLRELLMMSDGKVNIGGGLQILRFLSCLLILQTVAKSMRPLLMSEVTPMAAGNAEYVEESKEEDL